MHAKLHCRTSRPLCCRQRTSRARLLVSCTTPASATKDAAACRPKPEPASGYIPTNRVAATAAGIALSAALVVLPPDATAFPPPPAAVDISTSVSSTAYHTAGQGNTPPAAVLPYNTPVKLVAEVPWPPRAPSVPAPQTPPNSPLPTPEMPTPPFIPSPPAPSQPPQLLPPCPGNEPPPQKLLPNAPQKQPGLAQPAASSITGTGTSSLLGSYRHRQDLQQQWQQALLLAAFTEGAASHPAVQEPSSLPLPGDIPLPLLAQQLPSEQRITFSDASKLLSACAQRRAVPDGSSSSYYSSSPMLLAAYAATDPTEPATSQTSPGASGSDSISSAGAAPRMSSSPAGSKLQVVVPDSSRSSNSSSTDKGSSGASSNAQPQVSGFEKELVGRPDNAAASSSASPSALQQLQQLPANVASAAQRDPGVSDLLKALARLSNAAVRLAVPLLRLLVQVTAVVIQALVKLLVWGLDKAGQGTVGRVQETRQQNIARLAEKVQQQAGGERSRMAVLMVALEQQQEGQQHVAPKLLG